MMLIYTLNYFTNRVYQNNDDDDDDDNNNNNNNSLYTGAHVTGKWYFVRPCKIK